MLYVLHWKLQYFRVRLKAKSTVCKACRMFLLSSKDWIRRRLHHLGHCHRMSTRHDIGKIRQTQEVTKCAGSDQESGLSIKTRQGRTLTPQLVKTRHGTTWETLGNISLCLSSIATLAGAMRQWQNDLSKSRNPRWRTGSVTGTLGTLELKHCGSNQCNQGCRAIRSKNVWKIGLSRPMEQVEVHFFNCTSLGLQDFTAISTTKKKKTRVLLLKSNLVSRFARKVQSKRCRIVQNGSEWCKCV